MQSAFHNLPSFGGIQQGAGETCAARGVAVDLGESVASITMDIAGAYPAAARVARYLRTVRILKHEAVEIVDHYEGESPAELSLMLVATPIISDGRIVVGDLGEIALSGAGRPRVETIAITDARLRQAWPERVFRVVVPLASPDLRLRIS
jgi:hypothetical protein